MSERIRKAAERVLELRAEEAARFWANEATGAWPNDTLNYVFLARAVHKIGEALFPGVWTRTEPEEWAANRIRGASANSASSEAVERMLSVIRNIGANAAVGRLTFASRPENVLAFASMSWGSNPNESRFNDCRVGRQDLNQIKRDVRSNSRNRHEDFEGLAGAFGEKRWSRGHRHKLRTGREWIFITRESLEGWLSSIDERSHPSTAEDDLAYGNISGTCNAPKKMRRRTQRDRAISVIKEKFPNGRPDTMSTPEFVKGIQDHLGKHAPSRDTILRALADFLKPPQ